MMGVLATEAAAAPPDPPDAGVGAIVPDTEPVAEVALEFALVALEFALLAPEFDVPPAENEPLVAVAPASDADEPVAVVDSVEVGSSLQPARTPVVNATSTMAR